MKLKRSGKLALAALVVTLASDSGAQGEDDRGALHSALWGEAGELWQATSRLPDFSYAGYRSGEASIPDVAQVADVMDFGAVGDGVRDDTQAFLDAIESTSRGAIFVPAGRYRITQVLEIRKSGVVLRGAGPGETVLVCARPLNDIEPNWGETTGGRRTSNYSWSGGLVRVQGSFGGQVLASVTAEAKRGDRRLQLSSTAGLSAGQRVELVVRDDEARTLTDYLYSGDPGDTRKLGGLKGAFVVTLTEVTREGITFDRPLRFDVRLAWQPRLRSFAPTVQEVGIEELAFEFPAAAYEGHFTELGFNAIALASVADCWVRNVTVRNADSGVFVSARFCTLSGLRFESGREPWRGNTGHHGVTLGGADNLCTDFRFDTRFVHDLTLSARDIGNVYSNGSGVDLSFDHHRRAPYENLFTDIDIGAGTRLWASGGGQSLGKHCAARGTFWNIRAEGPQRYPGSGFGPQSINLVGVRTDRPSETEPGGIWFEALEPSRLEPQDLHAAQLARRLERERQAKDDGE